jgi:membrane-associated protease RseP (regulator of RpoE activity)
MLETTNTVHFSGVSPMNKPLISLCLAATGILAVGAFLLAQAGQPSNRATARPVVLAMQEPTAAPQEPAAHSPLANVGWIGIKVEENNGHGVRVTEVFPAGPAAMAGVRKGDILVRVDGMDLASAQGAEGALERLAPRKEATLTVERRRGSVDLKVTPESLADFKRDYIIEMMRRDPRDPNYSRHPGVSESDMAAEVVRRLFEQHERLERQLNEVLNEVHALRKQVAALQK